MFIETTQKFINNESLWYCGNWSTKVLGPLVSPSFPPLNGFSNFPVHYFTGSPVLLVLKSDSTLILIVSSSSLLCYNIYIS